jgi:aspartate aminotransferase-like enzyme
MSKAEMFEMLEDNIRRIGVMGQWYQRYDITDAAEKSKKIIKELKKELDPPCGMSRK